MRFTCIYQLVIGVHKKRKRYVLASMGPWRKNGSVKCCTFLIGPIILHNQNHWCWGPGDVRDIDGFPILNILDDKTLGGIVGLDLTFYHGTSRFKIFNRMCWQWSREVIFMPIPAVLGKSTGCQWIPCLCQCATWPSLSPRTVMNPVLLTYSVPLSVTNPLRGL